MTDAPLMAGKFVLVTGGTGGIGRATAIGLAALGARVGITGRDHALNHLAPFLLTGLLLDRLTASAPARIVTVSSGAHASGASTPTTCRASGTIPGSAPIASRSWPT